MSARLYGALPWSLWQEQALVWREQDPGQWPPDLAGLIANLRQLGALIVAASNERALAPHRNRVAELYGPCGEYLLAVVPHLLDRIDRAAA